MFHKLLDETEEVTLTSQWKEIKKKIKDDPRYTKFSSSDRVSKGKISMNLEIMLPLIRIGFCKIIVRLASFRSFHYK